MYAKKNNYDLLDEVDQLINMSISYHKLLDKINYRLMLNENISVFIIWNQQDEKPYLLDHEESNQLNKIALNDESITDFINCKSRNEYKKLLLKHQIEKVTYIDDDYE